MIRSMHIGKSNLSNNRHILKIYYTCQQLLPLWNLQSCTVQYAVSILPAV